MNRLPMCDGSKLLYTKIVPSCHRICLIKLAVFEVARKTPRHPCGTTVITCTQRDVGRDPRAPWEGEADALPAQSFIPRHRRVRCHWSATRTRHWIVVVRTALS